MKTKKFISALLAIAVMLSALNLGTLYITADETTTPLETTEEPDDTTEPPETTEEPDDTTEPPETTADEPDEPDLPEFALGDVDGNGHIDIFDVLEILKYLVGATSAITDDYRAWRAALITGRDEPSRCDAHQILRFLERRPNLIEGSGRGCIEYDTNHDGVVDINDALDILKFLVGMSSATHPNNNYVYPFEKPRGKALLPCLQNTEWVKGGNIPTIFDVLEILKYIVGIPGKVTVETHGNEQFAVMEDLNSLMRQLNEFDN